MGTNLLEAVGFDADISASDWQNWDLVQQANLGTAVEYQGSEYLFCKFNQDLDVSEGDALVFVATTTDVPTVSGDTTGNANGVANAVAGAATTAHNASSDSEAKYGWVQRGGYADNLTDTSNGISAGDIIVPDGSNDGEWKAIVADEEEEAAGVALEAASSNTFQGFLYP